MEQQLAPPSAEHQLPDASGTAAQLDSQAGPVRAAFPCPREGCPKVFGTLGHLSRHERSHTQDLRYACGECDKKFVRSDVLARHVVSVHGAARKVRKGSCTNCSMLRLRCDGEAGETCVRCSKHDLDCFYKPRAQRTPNPSGIPRSRTRSVSASVAPIELDVGAPVDSKPFLPPSSHHDPFAPTPSTGFSPTGSPNSHYSSMTVSAPPSEFSLSTSNFPLGDPSQSQSLQVDPSAPFSPLLVQEPGRHADGDIDMPFSSALENSIPPAQTRPPSPTLNAYSFSADRASAALQSMPPFEFSFSTLPYESYRGDVAASFDNSLGWGMGDTELDVLSTLDHQPGNQSPFTDWLRSLSTFQSHPEGAGFGYLLPSGSGLNGFSESKEVEAGDRKPALGSVATKSPGESDLEQSSTPADGGGPEASSDSMWPNIYQPTAPIARLEMPPVAPQPNSSLYTGDNVFITEASRAAMVAAVESTHKSPWLEISVASFPSSATLQVCCILYFQRFHPTFPILNKRRIMEGNTPPVLLLSIAAIGATFSKDGLEGLGVALTELVRRTLHYSREIDPRLSFEPWFIQAWLLHAIFGLYCGSRKLYQHSEISRCGLVTAARRMDLLRPSCMSVDELQRRNLKPTLAELHNAYLEDEERLRLGWGIYLFDTQICSLLNLQSLFSISEINAPFPDEDERFSAPSPEAWVACTALSPRPNFRTTLASLLSNGEAPQLNAFGASLVALTLYRLCIDAASMDAVLGLSPPTTPSQYRLTFSPSIKHNPQALLDTLAVSWLQTSSSSPSALLVSATALSHHATIQFSCGEFLSEVKNCAGKWGQERREVARGWIVGKMRSDPVAMRRILAHAAQLNALVMRFTFDVPSEVVWLADSAMALWAIVKFGGPQVIQGPNALQHRTSIKWSDSDNLEPWIQSGGPVSLKGGLGDFASLSPTTILSEFVEKLEHLPWGLSRKFRGVLMSLMREEEEEEEVQRGRKEEMKV